MPSSGQALLHYSCARGGQWLVAIVHVSGRDAMWQGGARTDMVLAWGPGEVEVVTLLETEWWRCLRYIARVGLRLTHF